MYTTAFSVAFSKLTATVDSAADAASTTLSTGTSALVLIAYSPLIFRPSAVRTNFAPAGTPLISTLRRPPR